MSEDRKEVVVRGDGEGLHHEVFVGSHRLAADEPPESGGSDRGPNPYDLRARFSGEDESPTRIANNVLSPSRCATLCL
jgi:hypothetical protein